MFAGASRAPRLLVAVAAIWGCGGRTPLPPGKEQAAGAPNVAPPCVADAECGAGDACRRPVCENGACVLHEVDCSDGSACTDDSCDAALGCVHRSLTVDADGDGHASRRPGASADGADACGDDCDDRNASVFPGSLERCDGVDNDCDGVIDNGELFVPSGMAKVRIGAPDSSGRETLGGLAGSATEFVASYGARRGSRSDSYLVALGATGARIAEGALTSSNVDSFGGSVSSNGGVVAVAWEEARQDGNYEIYFARFLGSTEKLGPELRVTDAPRHSLSPVLLWNGSEYLVVWDDRRAERPGSGENVQIYAQRISAEGDALGGNVPLTPDESFAENADVALGQGRIGLAFVSRDGVARLAFRVFDLALEPVGEIRAPLGEEVDGLSVHWVRDRFVVLFTTAGVLPGEAIWAAMYDADGQPLAPPRPVTGGGSFARWVDAVSLGDRLLMVWADDAPGNFELYYQILSPDLTPLLAPQRLTNDSHDSIDPLVALGPNGRIGIAFKDQGTFQSYLLTLTCQ